MRTSTEDKALLRYLYCREITTNQTNTDINQVLNELNKLEEKVGDYGISNLRSIPPKIFFSYLDRMGMITYNSQNPQVQLTELGRGLASRLKLPGHLENTIPQILSL